ncbi:MAG: DnaJ central domain protein [Verrucomicrobia bacterium ADurb.Bin345]|nr:MAG: DnaJ central domain protein [Verrucomicrobia bacterium ADurb.Bin345]
MLGMGAFASEDGLVLETIEGAQYRDVRVTQKTDKQVSFRHSAGICTINTSELTASSRERLGITNDPLDELVLGTGATGSVCRVCHGEGTIPCPTCQGTGFGPEKKESSPCVRCGGDGWIRREVPWITSRGGAGKHNKTFYTSRTKKCPDCQGTGNIWKDRRTYCPDCGGRKVCPCPECMPKKPKRGPSALRLLKPTPP